MTENSNLLTRRTAMRNAVLLLGGAIPAAQLGMLDSAFAATNSDAPPRFLDADQLAMVERVADLVIPETDTPGAVSAGAHRFIDVLLDAWASPDTQAQFVAELARINRRASNLGTSGFLDSSAEQQLELVQLLDQEAFAEGAPPTFFPRLKKLVLFAYFSSEAGATEALRFDRIPGDFNPCLSLADDDRAWFWLGYSYGL